MMPGSERPRTTTVTRTCPHCRDWHAVETVTEPGWERLVFCNRTGVVG